MTNWNFSVLCLLKDWWAGGFNKTKIYGLKNSFPSISVVSFLLSTISGDHRVGTARCKCYSITTATRRRSLQFETFSHKVGFNQKLTIYIDVWMRITLLRQGVKIKKMFPHENFHIKVWYGNLQQAFPKCVFPQNLHFNSQLAFKTLKRNCHWLVSNLMIKFGMVVNQFLLLDYTVEQYKTMWTRHIFQGEGYYLPL